MRLSSHTPCNALDGLSRESHHFFLGLGQENLQSGPTKSTQIVSALVVPVASNCFAG
jgi:hypothetical protein